MSGRLVTIAFVGVVVGFGAAFRSSFLLGDAIVVGAVAIAAIGFVLLFGLAGQIALGQPVFSAVGGYTTALLTARLAWDPFASLAAGVLGSMATAYAVGWPILRLEGFYLAMASLALQLVALGLAQQSTGLTGGAAGIAGVPPFAIGPLRLGSDLSLYATVWVAVALAAAVALNLDRSRIGRALRLIAESETAASAAGIDIAARKLEMFVVSAGFAAVSGSLLVHFLRFLDPELFGFHYSIELITAVIVGGSTSVWGGILGAATIVALREGLRGIGAPVWETVITGCLTLATLLFFPAGIAGALARLRAPAVRTAPPRDDAGAGVPRRTRVSAGALAVDRASKSFGRLAAVDDVSFGVPAGSITALIGPNGAGKTTLFNLISGLLDADAGRFVWDGDELGGRTPSHAARRGVARTFQIVQLCNHLTVEENVMIGADRLAQARTLEVALRLPRAVRDEVRLRAIALESLRFVGLGEAASLRPAHLSFGHRRLVEIARALASHPRLLLLDEPASGLDDRETEQLAQLLLRIRALGITVLIVEHDMRLVMGLADHVVVMAGGHKIAEAAPEDVRRNAEVVRAYFGAEA